MRDLAAKIFRWTARAAAGLICSGAPAMAADVLTHHNDYHRSGWNNAETLLTQSNVNTAAFSQKLSLSFAANDEHFDAQPLVVSGATFQSLGGAYAANFPNDVVILASSKNNIYVIDSVTGKTLVSKNFGAPVPFTMLPGSCNNNYWTIGITSTPVIDIAQRAVFFIAYAVENNAPVYRIHKASLLDLSEAAAPVVVSAQQTLSDGTLTTFNPAAQRQRPALLQVNSNIYAGFGSFCDLSANLSRGWVMGWSSANLAPLGGNVIFDKQTSAESGGGNYFLSSVWMSGYGLSADAAGNIFLATGNSNSTRADNLQESVVMLPPNLSGVTDYFTPANWQFLDQNDLDFGSGGVMTLPSFGTTNWAVAAGKDGRMFLLDRTSSMGNYQRPGRTSRPASTSARAGAGWLIISARTGNTASSPPAGSPRKHGQCRPRAG